MNVMMKYTYMYVPFSQKNECLSEHCWSFHLPVLDISTQSFLPFLPLNSSNLSQVSVRMTILSEHSVFLLLLITSNNFIRQSKRVLFKHFDRKNFIVDMETFEADRINNLTNNIFKCDNDILNDCYYAIGHNIFYQDWDLTGFSRVSFQWVLKF